MESKWLIQNDTEVHEISIDFLEVDDVGMLNFYVFWRGSICPRMQCSPQPGVELFGAVALRGDGEGRIQASDTTLEGQKHWGNTGEEPQEEPQETAFESTLALESLEPHWKFESLQSHCLCTQGQDCALGSNISIRAPVEKESMFWSVLAADLSQVHQASQVKIGTKLWAKLRPRCWWSMI